MAATGRSRVRRLAALAIRLPRDLLEPRDRVALGVERGVEEALREALAELLASEHGPRLPLANPQHQIAPTLPVTGSTMPVM